MTQTQTVEARQDVTITPALRTQLRKRLAVWQELQDELRVIKAAIEKEEVKVEAIREDLGVTSLDFETHKITHVTGETSYFDKGDFVLRGGDLALYNECQRKKPKKPYTLITQKKEK